MAMSIKKGSRGSARRAVKAAGGHRPDLSINRSPERRDPELWEIMDKVTSGELTPEQAANMISAKKGIKEASLDVSFQSGPGSSAQQITKTVQAANPDQALKQAMQGMSPTDQKGEITINPTPNTGNGQPGPGMQGGPPMTPGMTPNKPTVPYSMNQTESVQYPFRIMLPEAFSRVLETVVDKVSFTKMIVHGNRRGLLIEDSAAFNQVTNCLDTMKSPQAASLLDGIARAMK